MPPEVRVGQTASVRVEISAHALAPARGRASKEGKLGDAFDPSKPLTVQVMARANLEVSGADRVEDVKAPGPKDLPVELFFDVKGVSAGDGELWVMVRQGPPPLLTLTLAPEVVGAGAPEAETEAPARPRVRAESDVPATVPAPWLLPTLAVNERRTQDGVVYEYDLDLLEDGRYRSSSPPIQGDRDAYVNSIYSYLEDTWLETKDDLEKFRSEVRAYGGELFDQLFPKELQQRLWQHRARLKNIRILSTEPFIPWELVHLKSPGGRLPRETIYLAQMGLVRWLFDKPGPPTQLRVRDGRAWYVTPNYPDPDYVLEEPAKEAAFLEKMFAAKPVPASTAPVMALLTKRGKVDLFHFAGHGTATGGSVEDAAILLEGRYDPNAAAQQAYVRDDLTARRIEQEAELARPGDPIRPLVVLNACQVGRPGLQLSSIGGFAEAFIHAGAGAFVSSLWSVGDEPAASFTTELYRRLRAGDAIAKASVAAREKARAAGDATWLAYVVYAHPDAKLVRRP
jgi:hypothetical protein